VPAQRSEEVRIKALEAQIAVIKARVARKLARKDPSLRHIHAAVNSIDKALAASSDHAVRQALGEARNTLTACLALTGAMPKQDCGVLLPQSRRVAGGITEDALLSHVRANPGHRSEQIAVALGTDPDGIRPVMKRLIKAGRVRTDGRARAMSYSTT
jgi:hypothetical protein